MGTDVNFLLAFGAGLLSFVSPCMLPVYPSFLSYITGVSAEQLGEAGNREARRAAMWHSFVFLLGFSTIFLALGFSASLLGRMFMQYQGVIRQVGGAGIVLMGLFMIGLFQPSFLQREARIQIRNRPEGYLGSFLIGLAFAAGWTPCIGPILAAVLLWSATQPALGVPLMASYILGFSIPFLALTFFLGRLKALQRHALTFRRVGGAVMVLFGILLMTDQLSVVTIRLIEWYGFTGF